jgi:hypothetical protein
MRDLFLVVQEISYAPDWVKDFGQPERCRLINAIDSSPSLCVACEAGVDSRRWTGVSIRRGVFPDFIS